MFRSLENFSRTSTKSYLLIYFSFTLPPQDRPESFLFPNKNRVSTSLLQTNNYSDDFPKNSIVFKSKFGQVVIQTNDVVV